MRRVRRPSYLRLLAGLVILSMLPALFVPSGGGASAAAAGTYSRWIRAQLRVPADEAINAALEKASNSPSSTFESFVEAFLDAYEESRPEQSAAFAFTEDDLSDDALIAYLQRRYTEIGEEGVLPRTYLTTAAGLSGGTFSTDAAATLIRSTGPALKQTAGLSGFLSRDLLAVPLRTLTSARPLGP